MVPGLDLNRVTEGPKNAVFGRQIKLIYSLVCYILNIYVLFVLVIVLVQTKYIQ